MSRSCLPFAALLLLLAACDPPLPEPTTGTGFTARWSHGYGARVGARYLTGEPVRLTADPQGGAVVVGTVFTPVTFGAAQHTPSRYGSMFVTRLDAAGAHVWTRFFPGEQGVHAVDVTRDAAGALWVVAHELTGWTDYLGDLYPSGARILLLQLSADGQTLQERRLAGSGPFLYAQALAQGPEGLTLALPAYGALDLGTGPLGPEGGDAYADLVLAELDLTGQVRRAQRFGGKGNDGVGELVRGPTGDQALVGTFHVALDLGTGPLTGAFPDEVLRNTGYVARRDASGRTVFAHAFGGSTVPQAVALDAQGNTYVLATVDGTPGLGLGELRNAGALWKLDPSGATVWARDLGKARPYGLAVGADGRVLVTGHFLAELQLDGQKLTSAGEDDAFVATFDGQGHLQHLRSFGSPAQNEWGAVAGLDAAGTAYVAGVYSGPTDFGAGPLETGVGSALFVAAFDP